MKLKLRIMLRAIKIRFADGEQLDDIITSYPNLTKDEIEQLKAAL